MKPDESTTIVDVGASNYPSEEANVLEALYPHPEKITCATIGDGTFIRTTYPRVNWIGITPGRPLPFDDNSFDVAYSNAVLEHVGGIRERRFFVEEALRVARSLFMVVPNRWFPIEHHTGIPFLHYSSAAFRWLLSGGRYDHWASIENLDFLSARTIAREWPTGRKPAIFWAGLPLGLMSSNLVVVVS